MQHNEFGRGACRYQIQYNQGLVTGPHACQQLDSFTHPRVVQQAGDLLVAIQTDNLSCCTRHDAEIIAQQPVRATIDWAVGGGGGGEAIREAPAGGAGQCWVGVIRRGRGNQAQVPAWCVFTLSVGVCHLHAV